MLFGHTDARRSDLDEFFPKHKPSSLDSTSVNELQSIGAYVGTNDRVVSLLQRQVYYLAEINRKTVTDAGNF